MKSGSFECDELGSEDLEEICEISLAEYRAQVQHRGSASRNQHENAVAGPSRSQAAHGSRALDADLQSSLTSIETEIADVEENIKQLQTLKESLLAQRTNILQEIKATKNSQSFPDKSGSKIHNGSSGGINYYRDDFDWSLGLKAKMKQVFGIDNFRLCQEAVCNANMDGRDIVCVMPTGGGKSLTYQLPALMAPGVTLVVSPLIALMTDQIIHLQEVGVEAVMITSAKSEKAAKAIYNQLHAMAAGEIRNEIKLCYVTPEKISKSEAFKMLLGKLYNGGKLARIVIDEAHCVSQLGHDFRPDYKQLVTLRKLFPKTPILALSATCPPIVLKDLIQTLLLKKIMPGRFAEHQGTVYFSSPLYRKNLHYSVLPKESSANAAIKTMTEYILQNHEGDSGIIYCLSKKETEAVAEGVLEASRGKIKTGVYHADIQDKQKELVHERWRNGDVQVVCATIAFGLGIDKGNVRFVLHHSISKSIDGYYQESGRAGRDGKDADCVLFYRPQDGARLTGLTMSDKSGSDKVHAMLRFAQDMVTCRKIQFANYFKMSSHISIKLWSTDEEDALEPCGHCDNCTRAPETIDRKDVTLAAWKFLKVAEAIKRVNGRVTQSKLADLVRGAGKGDFGVATRKKKPKEISHVDVNEIAGGPVDLSKDEAETFCVHLLINDYLKEGYGRTPYSTNVYVEPGLDSLRYTRLSQSDVENGIAPKMELMFMKKTRKKATRTPKKSLQVDDETSGEPSSSAWPPKRNKKRKSIDMLESDDGVDSEGHSDEDFTERLKDVGSESADEEDGDLEWGYSLGSAARHAQILPRSAKRPRKSTKRVESDDDADENLEVISISSD